MKMNKKQIILLVGGLVVIGGVGGYLYYRNKKKQEATQGGAKSAGGSEYEIDDGSMGSGYGSDMDMGSDVLPDERFTSPIHAKLGILKNKDVASFLSSKLSNKEILDLRGWLRLIKKEHAEDPSKWGDANGLTGEVSQIAGALYQMDKGGQCNDCWNQEYLTAFLDAQR